MGRFPGATAPATRYLRYLLRPPCWSRRTPTRSCLPVVRLLFL